MDIGLLALFVVAGRWCLSFVVWLYPVLTTMVLITILHTIAEHQPDGYDGDPATLPARPVTRTTLPRALREVGGVPDQLRNPEGYDRRYFFRQGSWGSYYWPRHLNLFSPDGLDRLVRGAGLVPERRVDLLGPPCWVYTVMALNRSRARPLGWVEQFFTDTNPVALAPFAVLDALARLVGLPTSNQKLIARRA